MKTGFITIGLLLLLVCLPISVPASKANIVTNEGITRLYIISPSNTVYYSNVLTLNVSFRSEVWGNVKYSMVYSLDGQENKSLPLTDHYFSCVVQGEHDKCYDDGSVTLPNLSDGSHKITVYLQCDWAIGYGRSIGYVDYYYNDSQTVFFKVETTTPEISISLQNKTYSSNNILLNLTLNKPMSKITYSLDGQENVTTSGDITLKGLSNGEHDLVAYAEDNSSSLELQKKFILELRITQW